MRLVFAIMSVVLVLTLSACQPAEETNVKRKSESAPTVSPKPDPGVEVVWFWSDDADEDLPMLRFASLITNPGDRPIEGLETEWIAYDADDAIVGSYKGQRAAVPARGSLPYAGGAAVNLSGVPARVEVRITDPGHFVDESAPAIEVSDIKLKRGFDKKTYTVKAKAKLGPQEATSESLSAYVLLKDASGEVVGADFWSPDNLPETLPAGAAFTIEFALIDVTGKPESAEVTAVGGP